MVNSCAVPLCTNRCKPGSDIRFYFKIWLQRIRCESIPVDEYTRVCSAHFSGNPKRLGRNDIPSIFAWSKPTMPRPTRGRSTVFRYDGGESGCRDHRGKKHNAVSVTSHDIELIVLFQFDDF